MPAAKPIAEKSIARKVQVLELPLKTEPGVLGRVFRALREAHVNVDSCWDYQSKPGHAQCYLIARDTERAKEALFQAGTLPIESTCLWIETDETHEQEKSAFDRITKAGVNIEATDALTLDGRFGTLIWVSEKDLPSTCDALEFDTVKPPWVPGPHRRPN